MLPFGIVTLFSVALLSQASAETTTTVCSPSSCVNTTAPPSSLPRLGGTSSNGSYLLLPGTYSHPLPSALQANSSAVPAPLSGLAPFTNYSLSNSANPFYLLPSLQGVRLYADAYWAGVDVGYGQGQTSANASVQAGSLVLSPASWVKMDVGGAGERVVWSSLAGLADSPLGLSSKKGFTIVDVQSNACSTPCASGGSCISNDAYGSNGTCVCAAGFTGAACDECADGHWGPNCLDCASHCDTGKCSDGLTGNGQCTATVLANSTSTCSCLNGQCSNSTSSTSSSTCACSSGWASPNITSTHPSYSTAFLQCSICASGFTSSNGDCISCGPFATACSSAGAATACIDGYEVELGQCVASNGPSGKGSACSGSNFWDTSSSSCSPCSPTCGGKCSGALSTNCLNCASGKGLIGGQCVDVDSAKGTCDAASAGFKKTQGFWMNNALKACDSCPAKSTACSVSDYSSNSSRSDVRASACIDGYLLSVDGVCVATCPDGQFRDGNSAVCHICRGGCATCDGYASYCTSCSSGLLASDGSCVSACDSGTFASNGTCTTCHGDCSTCSGSSFDQCLSCPSDRPVLSNGRCLSVCTQSQYFNSTSASCRSCDASCSSCTGPSASDCLACASSDQVATAGTCAASGCADSLVPFLSVCLATFISKSTSSTGTTKKAIHVLTIAIPVLIVLMLLGVWLFVRHERRRTREASERWANGMDDIQVRKTTRAAFGDDGGVDGVLAFMGRAKDDLERRWKDRSDVRRVRARQRGLKPLKLAAGWQAATTKGDYELDDDMKCSRDFRSGARRHPRHPPPYTPSAIDDRAAHSTYRDHDDDSNSLRSSDDERDFGRRNQSSRPPSRYTIESSVPSPSYDAVRVRHRDPFSRDSLLSIPTLASPAAAAWGRPSHFRSQASLAPSDSRPSTRRRSIDLEDEPFPDFQKEYSVSRQHAAALAPTASDHPHAAGSELSHATSRFVEGDASDIDGEDDEDDRRAVSQSPLIQVDSPASFDSPPVIRGNYWLADPRSEGGRTDEDIRFAPSPLAHPSSASTLGDAGARRVGQNNPFRSAWV